jgi:DNA replication protein DnaC
VKDDLGRMELLERVEQQQREELDVGTALKRSGLPKGKTIANFDFTFQPSVQRSKIEALATSTWIRRKQSLLILGPPAVGKTHLAIALGVKAVECGFSVAFYRLDKLLPIIRKDADLEPSRLRRRKYMKVELLIIDEIDLQPFTRQDANLFFRVVSYRSRCRSICVTSNKPILEWPKMLAGDEELTAALLGRLLDDSHALYIRGSSYRVRDGEARVTESY